jgi:ribonuclease P protein component
VSVRFLPGDAPPRVAFAVGRSVGSAVTRNRVRRRLRAGARQLAGDGTLGGGSLLISTRPAVTELTFEQLTGHLRHAVHVAAPADHTGGFRVRA